MNLISIVIPAYNEEANLPSTIGHLQNVLDSLNQEYEIIVANNNSTDKTAEVAKNLGCIVVNQEERNIGKTRNAGADKACGEILIFVDADSRPSKKLVSQALSALEDSKTHAVSTVTTFSHYPTLFSYGVWFYNIASKIFGLGVGQFIAIKSEVFKSLNGFDESYYAFEEINFFKRLKQKFERKSLFISLIPVQTSPRKFEKGQANTSKFLLLLIASILGSNIGKNKAQLDFWYSSSQSSQKLTQFSKNYKKYIFIALLLMLNFDILFLITNSPIRDFSPYTTPIVFILFLFLFVDNLKSLRTFLIVWIFTILIEIIGVKIGFPFGFYEYNPNHAHVGLFGVPIFIGIAWFIITASVYRITKSLFPMVIGVVLVDLLPEVFAVSNNLWQWKNPTFLTAPYQNYIAWGIIAGIAYFFLKRTNFSLKYSILSLLALVYYMVMILILRERP